METLTELVVPVVVKSAPDALVDVADIVVHVAAMGDRAGAVREHFARDALGLAPVDHFGFDHVAAVDAPEADKLGHAHIGGW